ncbi:MAG: dTDP-glucose 4,6-dehydratase [Planctomycetes bacterium]|nr:dTDP-glucose 4,6-dehydratase [Planctomycetota bacterium]
MTSTILVTGGAGFIGSHLCERILARTSWRLVVLDKLTYAGSLDFLKEALQSPRCRFVKGDICDRGLLDRLFREHAFDRVANLAAESHVDRSIADPEDFIQSNIVGTYRLLETFRRHHAAQPQSRCLQVSTDEVYGSIPDEEAADENAPLLPNSPYSASKASADLLVRAYWKTYGLPLIITRTSNNFGPRQNQEKMIPTVIRCALADRPIPVYGDGLNVRDWIYVTDHCDGIIAALERGRSGEVYNLGGAKAITNLELVRAILDRLGKPPELISFVKDRPGHDRRYAIASQKAWNELSVRPEVGFEEGLDRTLQWYRAGWLSDPKK